MKTIQKLGLTFDRLFEARVELRPYQAVYVYMRLKRLKPAVHDLIKKRLSNL